MPVTRPAPRRYVVIGAGAIGCATAALLHESGQRVVLVARGATLEAVRRGIDVRRPSDALRVLVPTAATVDAVAPDAEDLVVLAVMGHHTEDAIRAVRPDVPVLSFQNGTAPLDALASRGHPTIAAMLYIPAERRGPGVVALVGHPHPGVVRVGPWPAPVGPTGEWSVTVADALTAAGLVARAEPDIAPWIRAKQLLNLGGIVAALCDAHPEDVVVQARDEARAVYAAMGEPVLDLHEFLAAMGPLTTVAVDGKVRVGGSTRGALARGEPLETGTLNGSIVAAGERAGVPTPVNAALVALADWAVRTGVAPGAMDADALRAWVGGRDMGRLYAPGPSAQPPNAPAER